MAILVPEVVVMLVWGGYWWQWRWIVTTVIVYARRMLARMCRVVATRVVAIAATGLQSRPGPA